MMNCRICLSPNYSRNRVINPKGILLHHSGGNWGGDIAWICDPQSKVSYHALINTNGDCVVFGADNRRMWHSGKSSFKGKSDCNSFMLGLAVTGDTNKRELTKEEIKSCAEWCFSKMQLYGFGIDDITSHKKVSPGRKVDISDKAERQIKEYLLTLLNN